MRLRGIRRWFGQKKEAVFPLFQQLRVAEGDGSQFLHGEVVVTHHPLEVGHIDLSLIHI